MPNTSRHDRRREEIAFGRQVEWGKEGLLGAVFFGPDRKRTFPPLPVGPAKTLMEEGYLDPDQRHQDHAPPAATLVDWAETIQTEHRAYQFEIGLIGYMISSDREDTRIAFEGVSIRSPGPIPEEVKAKAAAAFDPDLMEVDDFRIVLQWD